MEPKSCFGFCWQTLRKKGTLKANCFSVCLQTLEVVTFSRYLVNLLLEITKLLQYHKQSYVYNDQSSSGEIMVLTNFYYLKKLSKKIE